MKGDMQSGEVQHVFLVGAKSIGNYGGYETFVNKLTEYHQNNDKIKYHIACKANGSGHVDEKMLGSGAVSDIDKVTKISDSEFIYNNARCFKLYVPQIGAAQALYYDVRALYECCRYIKKERIKSPVVYIMACRIGPLAGHFKRVIHSLGGRLYINPDGHEWKRAKWNKIIRKYWKYSERLMIKHSDLVICDSLNIEKYIHESYDGKGIKGSSPKTTYIAYGAEIRKSYLDDSDDQFINWLKSKKITINNYYLAVGRFVPENNYEIMIREFMKSNSKKDFVIITTADNTFFGKLESSLHFKNDKRIKFVGTVYNQELLMKIRENAYGYFHGHEVGGTNPSLLEALASTKVNMLLNVGFNHEVAKDGALYWNKKNGNLAGLIDKVDNMTKEEIETLEIKAKQRIKKAYSWEFIRDEYEKVFMK